MGKKCQNANICFTSVCEVLYKGEMDKPTKLKLIAELLENPRPFEVRTSGDWVSPETMPPDSFVEDCWEIRIKPESATFEAHGKTWTRHKPGDPMPCDGEAIVDILLRGNTLGSTLKAKNCYWDTNLASYAQIIGWRYADKPAWKLPEPPAGKQWHRNDWTEKMLPEGWRPLLKDELIRGGDECRHELPNSYRGQQHGMTGLTPCENVSGRWFKSTEEFFWRTRRPLPAEPIMVPLEAADVPPGSVFEDCDGFGWLTPVAVTKAGVSLPATDNSIVDYTWEDLKEGPHSTRIKRPTDTDWQPCSKHQP